MAAVAQGEVRGAELAYDAPYMDDPANRVAVDRWMRRFVGVWEEPGGPDNFADSFVEYLDPHVKLAQPPILYPTCWGHHGFREQFRRWMTTIPDLNGEVVRWSASGDTVWIELELKAHGTTSRPWSWFTIERIVMREGLVVERTTFTDPTPVLLAAATRPRMWPHAWRFLTPVRNRGPRPATEPPDRIKPKAELDSPEIQALNFPEQVCGYLRQVVDAYVDPRGDWDRFVDSFVPYTHPDATFIQPVLMYPNCQGLPALRRQFKRWFRAIPDLRGEMVRWTATREGDRDVTMHELELTAWHDRRPFRFRSGERAIFQDGRIVERRSFVDPLPLLVATSVRPYSWPHLARSYLP